MSFTQSCASPHHSISLAPRTTAVTLSSSGNTAADFRLGAADLGDVARIGAELVPMPFIGQADERVQIGLAHNLSQ